jgi:hypothetical protein
MQGTFERKRKQAVLLTRTVLSAHNRAFFERQALRLDGEARERERLLLERGERAVNRRARLQPDATAALIERAIRDRTCLTGTYVEFRVRFAPHALGRDENGGHLVFAFEYGGLTLGQPHWVCFEVDRLRGLQRTGDLWRSGSLESRPRFDLTEIEIAVDDSWPKNREPAAKAADD